MTVWMSSGGFQTRDLEGLLREAKERGVAWVELASGVPDAENLEQILFDSIQSGTRFLVHNYFPAPLEPFVLNIASSDPVNREENIAFAKRAIDITVLVGAPFYSVHAGFAVELTADLLGKPDAQAKFVDDQRIDRDAALEIMLKNTRILADYAREHGVGLLLENNVVSPLQLSDGRPNPLLMTAPEESEEFLSAVDRENVGLLLDVGHAKVSAKALGFDPLGFFTSCGDWIRGMHLSDNDGLRDTNQPLSSQSWFYGPLGDFKNVPWVVEVYRMDAETMGAQIALTERAQSL